MGNRLTKKVTLGGSATTTDYSYDNANQMTAVNGTTYTYDFNGNMTGNGSQNFEYDADNRLVRVTTVSDGSLVASFEYDGLGRRTAKTTPAAPLNTTMTATATESSMKPTAAAAS